MTGARPAPRWNPVPIAIGVYAALIATARSSATAALLAAPLALAGIAWWTLSGPRRWIAGFIAAAILLPPLPIALGDTGPHPCLLFGVFGILAGVIYRRAWQTTSNALTPPILTLSCALIASLVPAALFSGPQIALQSFARILLFGIGVYLFFYETHMRDDARPISLRPLYWAASIAAAIACFDFYYQLPAPAGFAQQFISTDTVVYRRAQGFFYDASTLGNFCAFFLVLVVAAFTRRTKDTQIPRILLLIGGITFSGALIFSYSRASIANLVLALAALAWVDRARIRWGRAIPLAALSIAAAVAVSYLFLPDLAKLSWIRLSGSIMYLPDYGESVFSGRFESWRVLLRFLGEHPWHAIFGIGYKTLPYSDYIGQTVIADNMYLSMLIETGVVGLGALIWFNVAVLRSARKTMRDSRPISSLLGTWMFCFWLGQCVQMLFSDLLTYWRVFPIYFLVMAWVVRGTSPAQAQ